MAQQRYLAIRPGAPARTGAPNSGAPKRSDYLGAGFERRLHLFRKGIGLFAFDVNRAHHVLACPVKHRNNNLRPRRTKSCEIPRIAVTSPTFNAFRVEMAAPVSLFVMGNVGYCGAPGPL